jgi:hypothetical protein
MKMEHYLHSAKHHKAQRGKEKEERGETLVLKLEMKTETAKERWQTFHRILQQFQQQMKA